MGKTDAQTLRNKAAAGEVTDTEIIDNEQAVSDWSEKKDYSKAAVGTPVAHDGQVYGLIQPHNAAHYPNTTPATLAALWRVKHTTNPAKAKPFVKPSSTSDMYLVGECMIWTDGFTYRAKRDTAYNPEEYAADWEAV
jgi:hypothetical protein